MQDSQGGIREASRTEAPYTGPGKDVQKLVSGYAVRRRGRMSAGTSAAMAFMPGGLSSEEGSGPRSAGELFVSEEDAVPLSRSAMAMNRRSADGSAPEQPGKSPLQLSHVGLSVWQHRSGGPGGGCGRQNGGSGGSLRKLWWYCFFGGDKGFENAERASTVLVSAWVPPAG